MRYWILATLSAGLLAVSYTPAAEADVTFRVAPGGNYYNSYGNGNWNNNYRYRSNYNYNNNWRNYNRGFGSYRNYNYGDSYHNRHYRRNFYRNRNNNFYGRDGLRINSGGFRLGIDF